MEFIPVPTVDQRLADHHGLTWLLRYGSSFLTDAMGRPARISDLQLRSLELLKSCKEQGLRTKTGIMVGLGETREEVIELMQDCVDHHVDVLTIGQYMQPTKLHHPVIEWIHPDQFKEYKEIGEALGLEHVESGPLVRSSYHAERHV